jgi:DNA-directed RNA polymerase subunit RPC12/RpoP
MKVCTYCGSSVTKISAYQWMGDSELYDCFQCDKELTKDEVEDF